jgi:two-component system, OmpR family, response regulator
VQWSSKEDDPVIARVLVVEDEDDIAALVAVHLRDLGLEVRHCANGESALHSALHEHWNLLVLDLTLPRLDGIEVCREIRARGCYTPILMLTARTAESERALGLETGADDYVTKPFGVLEFVARVKAILRRVEYLRAQPSPIERVLRVADLEVDLDARVARRAGCRVDLTVREFELLAYLIKHPGKVFTRAQLLDRVWGLTHEAYEHTVSSHISRLRAKIELDAAAPRYLLTNWGTGYSLASS